MVRYAIALQKMGLKNPEIIDLLIKYQDVILALFQGKLPEIISSRLDLIQYQPIFADNGKKSQALEYADNILNKNHKYGIKAVCYSDVGYPSNLKEIQNPPAVIYYRGADFDENENLYVACVGTRKPTLLSYNAINYIVPQLVINGCVIVSGLALGVDKLSHQSCISAGGKTIAVVAHGLDMIYPKENIELAVRILHTGGTIMSEYPVGSRPTRYSFVDRNRLIVGLSKALVIYECDANGGTMYNATYGERQHKPIFCPDVGDTTNPVQTGTKQLIDTGRANVIRNGRNLTGIYQSLAINSIRNVSTEEIMKNYLKSLLNIAITPDALIKTYSNFDMQYDGNPDPEHNYIVMWDLVKDKKTTANILTQTLAKNIISVTPLFGE